MEGSHLNVACSFVNAPIHIVKQTGSIQVKGSNLILRAALPESKFVDSDLYLQIKSQRDYELENGRGQSFLISCHDSVFDNVHLRLAFGNDILGSVAFGWGPQVTTPEWA